MPTNEDAPKRLQEFIAKLEEKVRESEMMMNDGKRNNDVIQEDDIPEASDQPLDLSVSSFTATAISSPAPEIAPFPDDPSFNGSAAANANSANSPTNSATNVPPPHFSVVPSPTAHCTQMASPTQFQSQPQSSSSAGEKRPCPVDFKEDNEMISQV